MRIISHRGYWKNSAEKNTIAAFTRSFSAGFGTETDFRDHQGELFVAHDPPSSKPSVTAGEFFDTLLRINPSLPVAINVKSDGLQKMFKAVLERFLIDDYFLFDMSIPDTVCCLDAGLRVYTRQSDIEPHPLLYDQVAGVWMDSFGDESWITVDTIERHLDTGKGVCLVSPELHGRSYLPFWNCLLNDRLVHRPNLMICTDCPDQAREFFGYE